MVENADEVVMLVPGARDLLAGGHPRSFSPPPDLSRSVLPVYRNRQTTEVICAKKAGILHSICEKTLTPHNIWCQTCRVVPLRLQQWSWRYGDSSSGGGTLSERSKA